MGVQVGQILRQAALRAPSAIGVLDAGRDTASQRSFTYAELDLWARQVAAELAQRGVGPGSRVGLLAESSAHFVASWFGIVYCGAAVVPMSILSAAPEVAFRLQHAACTVLAHDDARASLAADGCAQAGVKVQAVPLSTLVRGDAVLSPLDMSPEATALLLYTSGTTGKAKGAAISHASLMLHTSVLVHHTLGLHEHDVVLGVLPLTHSYGCRMAMLAPFFALARVVLVPRFSAERTLRLMNEEGVTWLPAVPTMLAAWAEQAMGDKPRHLRWVLSAGAPLPEEIARRAEARLGVEVRQGYGMTEATFSTMNAPPDERVFGSVGRPVWGVEVRVVDDAGDEVVQGERGEVLARGHNLMTHYLFDAEATQEVTSDGFMHSGDIGCFDAQGRLAIVDRIKDLVIRGGHNVYPSEVEDALAAHPAVAEVAVIGRPDAYYGEEVVAVIVPRAGSEPTVEALDEWAAERLSRTKLPREYAFVSALPLGPSGKVQKRSLRAWLADGTLQIVETGRAQKTGTVRT